MASVPIKIPGVGESITEGVLARWLKPDGASVKAGEPLFELETDKASNVVPAEAAGVLKIVAAEGATVAIGAVVGNLDPDGSPAASGATLALPTKPVAQAASKNGGAAATAPPPLSPAAPTRRRGTGRSRRTLRLRAGGVVTKTDVMTHLDAKTAPTVPASSPVPAPVATAPAAPVGPRGETRQRMSTIRQRIAQRLVEVQNTAAILTTFNEADMLRVIELREI